MAILTYTGVGGNTNPMVNLADGEALTGAYAEYVVKEMVNVGSSSGGRRSSITEFGVYHTSQENCDITAGEIAQLITDMSQGEAISFYKKLGTYVKSSDTNNSPITRGSTKYGVITWTSGMLEGETGSVQNSLNGQLYVPFVDVDTFGSNLSRFNALISGGHVARARLNNSGSGFEVGIARARLGVQIKDFNSRQAKSLGKSDTAAGIADGVLEDRPLA